jgi:hypothetical protein
MYRVSIYRVSLDTICQFMLLFPMSIGGNDEHDRGPFIAVHRCHSSHRGCVLDQCSSVESHHGSVLMSWSVQAIDLLHAAYSLIEPAIAPLSDPNLAYCQLVGRLRV